MMSDPNSYNTINMRLSGNNVYPVSITLYISETGAIGTSPFTADNPRFLELSKHLTGFQKRNMRQFTKEMDK